jgi:hypothetical protein
MIKQHIRKKIVDLLAQQTQNPYTLYYSSLLDQLYVLYILIGAIAFLLLAHLSVWPVALLIVFIMIAYLFGAYRNFSFAITATQLLVCNPRKPFVQSHSFLLSNVQSVQIGINQHPLLDRIFIIPSNVYVQIFFANNSYKTFYTNIDFATDAKQGEKTLEDFAAHLQQQNIAVHIDAIEQDEF